MAELTSAAAQPVARLHNIESVMARLGVSRSTVFELIGSRRLPSVKVGRRRLVSESSLAGFINALEATEATGDPQGPSGDYVPNTEHIEAVNTSRPTRAPAGHTHDPRGGGVG